MSQQHRKSSHNKQASTAQFREMTMANKLLLGAVAALVLGPTAVSAADLPVKAAPIPIPIYDWTGFYIGGAGGGSLGGSNHYDPTGLMLTGDGFRVAGGLIGGTLGYNWQVSSFVVGFEGDLSWVDESGDHLDNGISPNADPTLRSFTKERWLGTARGRFGYAVNNLLFYVTGGYAAAGVDAGIQGAFNSTVIASSTATRSGWTGGGGIEWGFAPNWSIKWEWLFVKYENQGFFTALGDGPRSSVTLDDNVVRFGINYRFGGPAVVARY
jgi:outer membrane immunogenic protein